VADLARRRDRNWPAAEIEADEDGDIDEDYVGIGLVEE